MKRKIGLAAALLLAVGIGIFIQDLVRERILAPILAVLTRAGFVLGVYWRTQDQELIWGALVLVAVLLTAATFSRMWAGSKSSPVHVPQRKGRVDFWEEQLDALEEGIYYRWRFSQEIGTLIMTRLSLETGEPVKILEQQLQEGDLGLPEDIERFLRDAYKVKLHEFYTGAEENSNRQDIPEISPERLIRYLENPQGME